MLSHHNPERAETAGRDGAGKRVAWHALSGDDVACVLGTGDAGLSPEEVCSRRQQHGPNALEEAPPPSRLAVLLHQFRSPLISILLAAAVVMLLLGETIDAAVIAAVLALNAVIGFAQEWKAETAARALMQLVAPQARVIREGRERVVESQDLVPGDLALLESGARVPADLRLIAATGLAADESALTGESQPAAKHARLLAAETPLSDRENMAYAGTIVSTGRGRGYVVATGEETEIGRIAAHVRETVRPQTPLQRRMSRFAHAIALVVAVAAAAAFGIGVAMGESAAEMFMTAVALAVSAVPEGLPVVLTVTLAVGVRRMARRNAILRRLPAVETLGSTTVIGSDKTGTLTENRMTVQEIWTAGRFFSLAPGDGEEGTREGGSEGGEERASAGVELSGSLPPSLRLTLLAGVLANEAEVRRAADGSVEAQGDPTETALLIAASHLGLEPAEARSTYPALAEIPFEPERQYSASLRDGEGEPALFVKGAPERVLEMCARMLGEEGTVELDAPAVQQAAGELAARGLRVLAMAYRKLPQASHDADDLPEPEGLTFLGLQGMRDPPRAGVPEAIAACRSAGIRVVMITGDHAATARAIGRELGLAGEESLVLTGRELEPMGEGALRQRAREVSLYARVTPEHKLRVVRALQHHGEVVAVTGDGVNDAPALKAADIGVAMGRSGTDVAREAADMILADDNFVSIRAAVEEGRITFDNVRKVTFFLISTGAAEVLAIMATLLLAWPLPFRPAQILWLNLVTNGLQDVALAFEPGEADVLRRPPRRPREGVITPRLWERTAVAGLVMAAGTLLLFRWELDRTGSLARAQTVALTTMVLFQAFHVWNVRSETRSVFRMHPLSNRFLLGAVAGALLAHVAALSWGPLQLVLRLAPIEGALWGRMALAAVSIIFVMELHKLFRRDARTGRPWGELRVEG